jgi:hypothetical protein
MNGKGGAPLIHAEKYKRMMAGRWKFIKKEGGRVGSGECERRRTKGVPRTPDIQPSLTDQMRVISPVNQEPGAKH